MRRLLAPLSRWLDRWIDARIDARIAAGAAAHRDRLKLRLEEDVANTDRLDRQFRNSDWMGA